MIPRRLIMVVAATIAITVFAPVAASACRIDNDTEIPHSGITDAWFWFDCGVACGNYFGPVESGHSVSRPGKGGYVQAAGQVPKTLGRGFATPWVCEEQGDRVTVGAHGEVGVTFSKPDQDSKAEVTFTWTSKGGNDWASPISHKTTDYARITCWNGTP